MQQKRRRVLDGVYNVEAIVDKMKDKETRKVLYMIKWEGYPSSQNTWEPIENLTDIRHMVKQYNQMYANKQTEDIIKSPIKVNYEEVERKKELKEKFKQLLLIQLQKLVQKHEKPKMIFLSDYESSSLSEIQRITDKVDSGLVKPQLESAILSHKIGQGFLWNRHHLEEMAQMSQLKFDY